MSFVATNSKIQYLNLCLTDLAKFICVDFGKFEFLEINILNWCEALYSAYNSIFRHLDQFEWLQAATSMADF